MQIVNGYACFSCADVTIAQSNLNPAKVERAQALGVDPSRIGSDGMVKPKTDPVTGKPVNADGSVATTTVDLAGGSGSRGGLLNISV